MVAIVNYYYKGGIDCDGLSPPKINPTLYIRINNICPLQGQDAK